MWIGSRAHILVRDLKFFTNTVAARNSNLIAELGIFLSIEKSSFSPPPPLKYKLCKLCILQATIDPVS